MLAIFAKVAIYLLLSIRFFGLDIDSPEVPTGWNLHRAIYSLLTQHMHKNGRNTYPQPSVI